MSLNPQNCHPAQEQHETYPHPFKRGKMCCQYDYRHKDGELFSCVAPTIEAARIDILHEETVAQCLYFQRSFF